MWEGREKGKKMLECELIPGHNHNRSRRGKKGKDLITYIQLILKKRERLQFYTGMILTHTLFFLLSDLVPDIRQTSFLSRHVPYSPLCYELLALPLWLGRKKGRGKRRQVRKEGWEGRQPQEQDRYCCHIPSHHFSPSFYYSSSSFAPLFFLPSFIYLSVAKSKMREEGKQWSSRMGEQYIIDRKFFVCPTKTWFTAWVRPLPSPSQHFYTSHKTYFRNLLLSFSFNLRLFSLP